MRNSKKCEEQEQYCRSLCLRIECLTKKTKEDANDVLNQVRDLFKEAEVGIADAVLDRAHRISKENNDVVGKLLEIEHLWKDNLHLHRSGKDLLMNNFLRSLNNFFLRKLKEREVVT